MICHSIFLHLKAFILQIILAIAWNSHFYIKQISYNDWFWNMTSFPFTKCLMFKYWCRHSLCSCLTYLWYHFMKLAKNHHLLCVLVKNWYLKEYQNHLNWFHDCLTPYVHVTCKRLIAISDLHCMYWTYATFSWTIMRAG